MTRQLDFIDKPLFQAGKDALAANSKWLNSSYNAAPVPVSPTPHLGHTTRMGYPTGSFKNRGRT